MNPEKELTKFVNDAKYREKVIANLHKNMDRAYENKIKVIRKQGEQLSQARVNEIQRISNARWQSYAYGKVLVNETEGRINVNGSDFYFTSIKGAEINQLDGNRIVTTEKGKTKKHGSLGGAVVGGVLLGPAGAIVGGVGLGKKEHITTSETNQIPTCNHLGVLVNLDGFTSEVVLIPEPVDRSSKMFFQAQNEAQALIGLLNKLSKTPVPETFLLPEQEDSVKKLEAQITEAQKNLQLAIADKPVYALPPAYRTEEQKDLSDEDYLQYLKDADEKRAAERAEQKSAEKEERAAEKVARKANHIGTKSVGDIIYTVVFWILSVATVLLAVTCFVSNAIASGILLLLTGLLINPSLEDLFSKNVKPIPKWVAILIFIIGFAAGVLTFPAT